MIIHYHNRSKLSEDKEQGAIYHDSLKSLFSVSDVLSICCPATKETENMINKETVEYFPKGAVITNVARGDIVDDEALIDALNRRKIYAAGLDVYKNEPNLNPGYLKNKSVFILPHLGSATKDTRTAMANLAIDNIDEFYANAKENFDSATTLESLDTLDGGADNLDFEDVADDIIDFSEIDPFSETIDIQDNN